MGQAHSAHRLSTAHSKSRRSHPVDADRVTLVWLSPGLPADRTELAASLPSDFALFSMPSFDDPAAIDALAVGSLCVATVFETELRNQLALRPEGVRLLVVGPPDSPSYLPSPPVGRPPDALSPASSMSELASAISHAAAGPSATAPLDVAALAPAAAGGRPSRTRSRLVAAGAVLAGLAIGGVLIGVTEGSSSASAGNGTTNGRFGQLPGGGQFPGGGTGNGQFPGGGPGNGQLPGGTNGGTTNGAGPQAGGRFDRDAIAQDLLTCLHKKGFAGTADQLRLRQADPQLRQAFETCVQQLRNSSSQLPGRP